MSSWHRSQLTYALGIGSIMSFYGVIGFVVMMMPEGSIGRNQRFVVLGALLITMPFVLLAGYVTSRRAKKKEAKAQAAAAAATGEKTEAGEQGPAPDVQPGKAVPATAANTDVAAGAEVAVQFLKSSNLGSGGKDAVYSLPWYLVVGLPKSGKSSLVIGAGESFQVLPGQRQGELKVVRPTQTIDWRITSDAVYIDTSGRYQNEGVDIEEWSSLLETIKKYRPNRPIDGLLLVVDSERILKSEDRNNEEIAKNLRARLDDAMQRLKVRFPVYLIFSRADSIEGFRDSFSASKQEDKELVWGSTIPLEKTENSQALFDGEFEILQDSVMKRRVTRLSAPFPPLRQLRIFNFPLHFGSARRKFGSFVNALFRPNPFSENPFLRGFYFTATPAAKSSPGVPPVPAGSYFSERLFRDVILRDKDLVRTFIEQRQRAPIMGWVLTFLGALVVIGLLALAAVSLVTNKQMLDDIEARGQSAIQMRKADAGKDILAKSEEETRNEINTLDELRELLVTLDDHERNGAPLYMRFGLYSGNRVYRETLLPNYYSLVEQRFRIPTIKKMEADLRKFASGKSVANPKQLTPEEEDDLNKHYKLLKAYLMISGGKFKMDGVEYDYRDRAEATDIITAVEEYWVTESKIPESAKATALQHLNFWANQVDRKDGPGRFSSNPIDQTLVNDARVKLQSFPAEFRYYSRKVSEISREVDDKAGATTVEAILIRYGANSAFLEGGYRVPGAFTRAGYDLMNAAIADSANEIGKDDWVMGEQERRELSAATDATRLQDRYHREYADQWRAFVRGINIKEYRNASDASEALQELSLTNSPLRVLTGEIAKNTNLSAAADGQGFFDWIMSFVRRSSTEQVGNSEPEKQFRPLFSFVGTPDKPGEAPLDKYISELKRMADNLAGKNDEQLKRAAQEMANDKDPLGVARQEKAINSTLGEFSETASAQDVATLLKKPLDNVRALIGEGVRSQLEKEWNEQILPAAREIEKGYPFEDTTTDASLTNLTAFLNPSDGKFSKFYDEKLSRYFEEVNGELRLKETAEIKFGTGFITYLNNLMKLRKALFGTNATPKAEFEFNLKPVEGGLVEVTIDGQKITSDGTGSFKGSFPSTSSETGVLINISSLGGADSSSNSGGPAQRTFPGSWGLLRFVDAAGGQKQAGGEYNLAVNVGGKNVTATVRASGDDIFDKELYRKVKATQDFLK